MHKRVLICPLDWGLGHATRCIPLIRELENRQCSIVIATSGPALALLRQEFPGRTFYEIVSYGIRYARRVPLWLSILFQLPKFLSAIRKEHLQVERIAQEEKIDCIISDNRYGCWGKSTRSAVITHQVVIQLPGVFKMIQGFVNIFNRRYLLKFDECWVPDLEDHRLTGALTIAARPPLHFIGVLSRMKKSQVPLPGKYKVLALLSGPEPQRTVFEDLLSAQLAQSGIQYRIVRGLPDRAKEDGRMYFINHLNTAGLRDLIEQSEIIICRPGYSTIMDLAVLSRKAIFVPTPGQTEQLYLADKLAGEGIAFYQHQANFDLTAALEKSKDYVGFMGIPTGSELLSKRLDNFVQKRNG